MSETDALIAFSLAALVMTMTPGLDTLLVLRARLLEGPAPALAAALGIGLGCLLWAVAASLGITALLLASEWGALALRWGGAAYLLSLGWRFLRSPAPRLSVAETTMPSGRTTLGWFRRGLLTNLLNPKVGVFYMTLLPQFLPRDADPLTFPLVLAGIHVIEGLLWSVGIVLLSAPFAALLSTPRAGRIMNGVTGALLMGLGVKMLLDPGPSRG